MVGLRSLQHPNDFGVVTDYRSNDYPLAHESRTVWHH